MLRDQASIHEGPNGAHAEGAGAELDLLPGRVLRQVRIEVVVRHRRHLISG